MKITQIPLLRDNYGYLLVCEKTNRAAIVDPSEAAPVLRRIDQEKVIPTAILNTHHHRDHTGGNEGLLAEHKLRVYGHKSDQARVFGLTDGVDEGDAIQIGELSGEVYFIPGHTTGHVAYLFENNLFCGDALFTAGCGRLFEGTPEQMHGSLKKLMNLPDETKVYCGHEYT
ncbi:MAG TPA: hydroxyacylglutathione hydrolase, partial [Candidatus Binatus sp.]|nr:hydroxyacylglutathione hydrolase [Candidatus Binatus sp.]